MLTEEGFGRMEYLRKTVLAHEHVFDATTLRQPKRYIRLSFFNFAHISP